MTLTKFPNGVSSYGLPVVGGAHVTTGTMFFVDSNTGSNSYDGRDSTKPFSTITYALGKCTANKGDIIYVMPSHVESADVNVSVAGVSIIGLGQGAIRPRLQLTVNTSSSLKISSCDVLIENLVITSSCEHLIHPVEVLADDFTMLNCEWQQTESSQNPKCVVEVASSANSVTIRGLWACAMSTSAADGTGLITLRGGNKHTIADCFLIAGKASSTNANVGGCIASCETATGNDFLIANNVMCVISSCSTGGIMGLTTNVHAGMVIGNYLGFHGTAAGAGSSCEVFITQTDMTHDLGFFNNLFAQSIGVRGASSLANITPSCSD